MNPVRFQAKGLTHNAVLVDTAVLSGNSIWKMFFFFWNERQQKLNGLTKVIIPIHSAIKIFTGSEPWLDGPDLTCGYWNALKMQFIVIHQWIVVNMLLTVIIKVIMAKLYWQHFIFYELSYWYWPLCRLFRWSGFVAGVGTWQVEQSHLILSMASPPFSILSPLREVESEMTSTWSL